MQPLGIPDIALGDATDDYLLAKMPRVSFYGRILDPASLVREKAQFARRWPVRRYSLRPNTVRVRWDEQARPMPSPGVGPPQVCALETGCSRYRPAPVA